MIYGKVLRDNAVCTRGESSDRKKRDSSEMHIPQSVLFAVLQNNETQAAILQVNSVLNTVKL